ncbi:hypothetical protein BLNAU_7077 [Blattamonas nauphoetae]|uniref:Secreted protein n=1 Tax=Blattamonas nauphoetae TaxID=2049346 RepID=A0ABQ9Y2D7_9EUKA|nr:hypothetical protein BLNAU_7077 [Blattamonas nauphoetae]
MWISFCLVSFSSFCPRETSHVWIVNSDCSGTSRDQHNDRLHILCHHFWTHSIVTTSGWRGRTIRNRDRRGEAGIVITRHQPPISSLLSLSLRHRRRITHSLLSLLRVIRCRERVLITADPLHCSSLADERECLFCVSLWSCSDRVVE